MNPLAAGVRYLAFLTLGCAGALSVGHSQTKPPAPADPVDLPAFNVDAKRIPAPMERWQYISLPGYEVISNASEKNTRLFIEQFHLLRQVTAILLPSTESASSVPTYIVLCGKGGSFENFAPPSQEYDVDLLGSVFVGDKERAGIVVDYTVGELSDPFRNFKIQYFRNLIRRGMGDSAPPLWFEEGMSQLFAQVEYDETHIKIGHVGGNEGAPGSVGTAGASVDDFFPTYSAGEVAAPPSTGGAGVPHPRAMTGMPASANGAFNRGLDGVKFVPLDKFFSQERKAFISGQDFEFETFRRQAYMFTHMCLFGWKKSRFQKSFFQLLTRSKEGPITEAVFQECFGMSYKQMNDEMRGYVSMTDYKPEELKGKNGSTLERAPAFTIRQATDSESSRIAGEVLRLGGSQEESLNRLIAPYIRGERDAELLAALGIAELIANHEERARKFLEAAATGKTTRVRAWYELGRLRTAQLQTVAATQKRAPNPEEFKNAIAPFYGALKNPPPLPEVFLALSAAWKNAPVAPNQQEFSALIAGAMRFPTNLKLVYQVAEVAIKFGHTDEARALVAHGIKFSPDEATKGNFVRLAALLPKEKKTASLK